MNQFLESLKNVSSLFAKLFELRFLFLVATLVLGVNNWFSAKDTEYWKGKADQIELKPTERARIVLQSNHVAAKYVVKKKDGKEKVETKAVYVPPESKSTIIIPKDPEKPIEIHTKTVGLCFKVGGGGIYGLGKAQPILDVKLAYMSRYGLNVGIAPRGPTLGVSRHVDDLPGLRRLNFQNVEVYGGYQHPIKTRDVGKPTVFVGLRTNF